MNPRHIILRNFAWSDEYDESSFSGRLHEFGEWSVEEYWLLEWALYQLASSRVDQPQLDWPVFRIFSHTLVSLDANLDPNDGFDIVNIDKQNTHDLRERLQMVFEGYFSGEMPDQASFEPGNPLLSQLQ